MRRYALPAGPSIGGTPRRTSYAIPGSPLRFKVFRTRRDSIFANMSYQSPGTSTRSGSVHDLASDRLRVSGTRCGTARRRGYPNRGMRWDFGSNISAFVIVRKRKHGGNQRTRHRQRFASRSKTNSSAKTNAKRPCMSASVFQHSRPKPHGGSLLVRHRNRQRATSRTPNDAASTIFNGPGRHWRPGHWVTYPFGQSACGREGAGTRYNRSKLRACLAAKSTVITKLTR